jgi:phage regulator Rha-like protein
MSVEENTPVVLQIEQKIFNIRGMQVMLDSDLAKLYGVETKVLNQAVKRNIERFPETFSFKLHQDEYESLMVQKESVDCLRSQIVTLDNRRGQHRKYLPFAFTEQGVAMLSAVLRSETAVLVSIRIMQAFVVMRKAFVTHAPLIQRVERLEEFKNEANARIDLLFSAIEEKSPIPEKGIFFEGEVFDAWVFISDLVRSAKLSILLIDNFCG